MTSYAPEHLPLCDRPSMCFCSVAGPLLLLPQAAGTSNLIGPFGGRRFRSQSAGVTSLIPRVAAACVRSPFFALISRTALHSQNVDLSHNFALFTTIQRGIVSQPWKRSTTTTTHTHD